MGFFITFLNWSGTDIHLWPMSINQSRFFHASFKHARQEAVKLNAQSCAAQTRPTETDWNTRQGKRRRRKTKGDLRWRRSKQQEKERGTPGRREEEEPTEQAREKKGSPCECYVGTSCRNLNQLNELVVDFVDGRRFRCGKNENQKTIIVIFDKNRRQPREVPQT